MDDRKPRAERGIESNYARQSALRDWDGEGGVVIDGVRRRLRLLVLIATPIGDKGVAALAAPLRKLSALKQLHLGFCDMGDEGVASLFANLGKDDFKALEYLWLWSNQITDAGMTTLVAALDAGRLPRLLNDQDTDKKYFLQQNPASASAVQAVEDALAKRSQ